MSAFNGEPARKRDGKFPPEFLGILKDSNVENLRPPRLSPNLNAYAERFVWSIKSECLKN
jgi:putative transposase